MSNPRAGEIIRAYNESLTPEQKREVCSKAGKASGEARKKAKTIREIARLINENKAPKEAEANLKALGIQKEDMTCAAVVAMSVFMAASQGDIKAVEKWERYIGQTDDSEEGQGSLAALIAALQK